MTNINTGSGVRRIIFKRQQCIKVNNGILISTAITSLALIQAGDSNRQLSITGEKMRT